MGERGGHYQQAVEALLRARGIPYVRVDQARRPPAPGGWDLSRGVQGATTGLGCDSLKSFDYVVYSSCAREEGGAGGVNLLADVKGRKAPRSGRLETWATAEDVACLERWEGLFGRGYEGALVFVYWLTDQPRDGLLDEVFEHRGRWYGVRVALLSEYRRWMKPRSARWRTVDLPAAVPDCLWRTLASSMGRTAVPAAGRGTGGVAARGEIPTLLGAGRPHRIEDHGYAHHR